MRYDAPVIITGAPRTGTTGLQCTLTAMDQVCIWCEFQLYVPGLNPMATVLKRGGKIADRLGGEEPAGSLRTRRYPIFFRNPLVQHVALRSVLNGIDPSWEPQTLREYLFDTFARYRGEPVFYGDKTPRSYACQIEKVFQTWPKAKMLFCMRDGRDTAASRQRGNYEAIHGATTWLEAVDQLEAALRNPELAERIHVVKMEDGVEDKVGLFRGACEFIGMDYKEDNAAVAQLMYRPQHVGAWKRDCPNIEREAGGKFVAALRRWGYA